MERKSLSQFVRSHALTLALLVLTLCDIAVGMYGLTLLLISLAVGYFGGPLMIEGIIYLGISAVVAAVILGTVLYLEDWDD